jgi:hypothetical protein
MTREIDPSVERTICMQIMEALCRRRPEVKHLGEGVFLVRAIIHSPWAMAEIIEVRLGPIELVFDAEEAEHRKCGAWLGRHFANLRFAVGPSWLAKLYPPHLQREKQPC